MLGTGHHNNKDDFNELSTGRDKRGDFYNNKDDYYEMKTGNLVKDKMDSYYMTTGNKVKDKNDFYHMSTATPAIPDLLFRKNSKYDSFAMSTGTPEDLAIFHDAKDYENPDIFYDDKDYADPQPKARRDFLVPKQQTPMPKVSMHATPPPLSGYNQNTTGRMSQLTSLSLGTPDSPFEFPSPYFPPSQEYKVERRFTKARRFREPTPMYDSTSSSDNFPDAGIKVLNAPKQTGKRSSMATVASPWDPSSASVGTEGPTPTNLIFI